MASCSNVNILKRYRRRKPESGPSIMAVALRKNRVVSVGYNSYTKTHPKQAYYAKLAGHPKKEYLHAEIDCLLRAPRDADTLLVVRLNKEGTPVNSKPCPVCALAIGRFNPDLRVIHT